MGFLLKILVVKVRMERFWDVVSDLVSDWHAPHCG